MHTQVLCHAEHPSSPVHLESNTKAEVLQHHQARHCKLTFRGCRDIKRSVKAVKKNLPPRSFRPNSRDQEKAFAAPNSANRFLTPFKQVKGLHHHFSSWCHVRSSCLSCQRAALEMQALNFRYKSLFKLKGSAASCPQHKFYPNLPTKQPQS